MRKIKYLLPLFVLILAGCQATSLSSVPSSNSNSTSNSTSSSSSSSNSDDSSSTSASSTSSSSSSSPSTSTPDEPIEKTLTVSRDTWPSLGTYKEELTAVIFEGVTFKHKYAGNYTANVIQGKKNEFQFLNSQSLERILSITMVLTQANNVHTMYAGTTEAAITHTITPQIHQENGNHIYFYDFVDGNYPYFNFKNGNGAVLYILEMVIRYSSSTTNPGGGEENETGYQLRKTPAINRKDYNDAAETFALTSTGNQKMLVIPVTFKDFPLSLSEKNDYKAKINHAFFGSSEETGWESVTSFYQKSSYGKLNLSGEVTDFYEVNSTAISFASWNNYRDIDNSEQYDPTWTLLEEAFAWAKTSTGRDYKEYDQDQDGFIDAIWLIYANPYSMEDVYTYNDEKADNVFWAYTYFDYDNYDYANKTKPVPMNYAWASVEYMNDGGYGTTANDVDAHTYIHETGHILGLDDYYSYSNDDYGAAGGLEMMDYNMLDHNAYSKYLLEWVSPFYIDNSRNSTRSTLLPFESSGQFILINNTWNGSPYDEYLLIEFYTPTGLNASDSGSVYEGNGAQGYTIPGVKIYHIDSRLGKYNVSDGKFLGYTDTIPTDSRYYPYVAHSNSVEYSENQNFKLVHLIDKGKDAKFSNNEYGMADNGSLFVEGDTFSPTGYKNMFYYSGKFNDQTAIGYSITLVSLSLTQVTLEITRI